MCLQRLFSPRCGCFVAICRFFFPSGSKHTCFVATHLYFQRLSRLQMWIFCINLSSTFRFSTWVFCSDQSVFFHWILGSKCWRFVAILQCFSSVFFGSKHGCFVATCHFFPSGFWGCKHGCFVMIHQFFSSKLSVAVVTLLFFLLGLCSPTWTVSYHNQVVLCLILTLTLTTAFNVFAT